MVDVGAGSKEFIGTGLKIKVVGLIANFDFGGA